MKYTYIISYVSIVLVIALLLTGCVNTSSQIQDSMVSYSQMIGGSVPEDLCLTIYYLQETILFLRPLNVEDLINFPRTQKIVVEYEELMENFEPFRKLDVSAIKPAKDGCVDARLYYVLSAGESGNLLEVVDSCAPGFNSMLNGIEVKYDPVFRELVNAFLPE